MLNPHAPPQDLAAILNLTRDLWKELKGERIFVTGGTGFFGSWLLQALAAANDQHQLNLKVVVLTRDPAQFAKKVPRLSQHSAIEFLAGDILTFAFPQGSFSHVIHAATPASAKLNEESPLTMFDTVLGGTRRALEFARASGAKKFLLTSSGAVYGKQPSDITHVDETYAGAPDPLDPRSAYGEAKRAAEFLCATYQREHGIEAKIARCFAFVGPYLPLDAHFAIGNFVRDVLKGNTIQIGGDGTPYRSYLYASDLVVWLLTILIKGQPSRPYNVGSEEGLPIAEIARAVAAHHGLPKKVQVKIAKAAEPGKAPDRYVPSTGRTRMELGLKQTVSLEESIRKTVAWYQG